MRNDKREKQTNNQANKQTKQKKKKKTKQSHSKENQNVDTISKNRISIHFGEGANSISQKLSKTTCRPVRCQQKKKTKKT
jgi:hypothetical protein